MVTATAAKLKQVMERDLSSFDVRVLLIDAVRVGGAVYTALLALDGRAPSRYWASRGRNRECNSGHRSVGGVDRARTAEMIAIGACWRCWMAYEGAGQAVRSTFGQSVAIQRCQVHKLRNVSRSNLPDTHQAQYRRKISAAYADDSACRRTTALDGLSKNSTASTSHSNSLREGIDETLTVSSIRACGINYVAVCGQRTLIESLFSHSRHLMKNVRALEHERAATTLVATVLLEAEQKFRRIKGHKEMPALVAVLSKIITE